MTRGILVSLMFIILMLWFAKTVCEQLFEVIRYISFVLRSTTFVFMVENVPKVDENVSFSNG